LNILKIDSAIESTMRLLNQPPEGFSFTSLVDNIKRFRGSFFLQTLFVKGIYKGVELDNSSGPEITEWLRLVEMLRPRMVMVYTISRDTPSEGLRKISPDELQIIAGKVEKLGIEVQVSF
jgi:hypothetical protein